MNYIVGSLPLPVKMLVGTMGVRGSKKRGLESLERVSVEGQWARDAARVLLVDLYKREKRWTDAFETARQLSEKYPRNYLFKLQMADALVSEILALRKKKEAGSANREQQVLSIFTSLLRDKTLDRTAIDLINHRLNITRQQLAQR
jgi:lipopolysaccharide biosynthesis regulator YciM